jgi:acetyltransferase-like isoleucine patch superfamily enzyme
MRAFRYRRKFPECILRIGEILLKTAACTWWTRQKLRWWGATVGRDLQVTGRVRFRLLGNLHIGQGVRLASGYANYVGASEPMAIWVCPGGEIRIGDGCRLSNTTMVCATRIDILAETLIGGGCRLYDTDFHPLAAEARVTNSGEVAAAPIRIGPRAFIGGHCTILKGVSIGENSIVGAGSLVTKSVPAGEVWGGVPARFIRSIC